MPKTGLVVLPKSAHSVVGKKGNTRSPPNKHVKIMTSANPRSLLQHLQPSMAFDGYPSSHYSTRGRAPGSFLFKGPLVRCHVWGESNNILGANRPLSDSCTFRPIPPVTPDSRKQRLDLRGSGSQPGERGSPRGRQGS